MNSDLGGMEACPACSKDFRKHRYALLSSFVEDQRSKSFLEDMEKRKWRTLLSFKEWKGDSDVLRLYAIKCPSGAIPTVLVRSPFEPFEDDYVLSIEVLGLIESQTLWDVASKRNWKPLPSL